MSNTDNYLKAFKIIDIKSMTLIELKRRYRILVKKHHPDMGGEARFFRFIQESYDYLKPLVSQHMAIELKKFYNTDFFFYSDGSLYDIKKKRWMKFKGKRIKIKE